MPTYTLAGGVSGPINIAALVAQGNQNGPLPHLTSGGGQEYVHQDQNAHQTIDGSEEATIGFGLLTCASVIYASTDPAANLVAHVHHAGAGHVTPNDVHTALADIGGAPAHVVVIYAHPKPTDVNYAAAIATIAAQGIPAQNILEIPDLWVPQFGINGRGQVGF